MFASKCKCGTRILHLSDNKEINALVSRYAAGEPEYDFVANDGFGHHLWIISDKKDIHVSLRFLQASQHFM